MVAVFRLKLDTLPRSAILDLLFIARRPGRVLPTSLRVTSHQNSPGTTEDEAGSAGLNMFWHLP